MYCLVFEPRQLSVNAIAAASSRAMCVESVPDSRQPGDYRWEALSDSLPEYASAGVGEGKKLRATATA
jgi:hypothetical protein